MYTRILVPALTYIPFSPLLPTQAEAYAKLDEVNDKDRQSSEILARTRAEISTLKSELERVRSRNKDDHDILTTENEDLNKKVEVLKYDKVHFLARF